MALTHGSDITSEEIERIVSREFTPTRFASLCNSLVFALSGQTPPGLPSFTERINVKDGGIDAEWNVEFPSEMQSNSPLIQKGWNVYQYKQRDIFARGREDTFDKLKSGLKNAVKELYDRTKKRPAQFVLFTNLDLTHFTKAEGGANPQKAELKDAILEGYDQAEKVEVQIVSTAELSAFLNNVPHIRSAFFADTEFCSWQDFLDQQVNFKGNVFGTWIDLVGRDGEMKEIKAAIDNENVRVIVLYGPHNIGKSRLVIETTQHRFPDIVVSLDPPTLGVGDIIKLRSPSKKSIVIIDDPEIDDAGVMVNAALKTLNVKLILTVPQEENAPIPNFGEDTRICSFQIKPLVPKTAEELLKKINPHLDHSLESWILEQAGGNPGIIIVAGRLGQDLRNRTKGFREEIGAAFARTIELKIGKEYLNVLEFCSVMSSVGIFDRAQAEIGLICSLIGSETDVNKVIISVPKLIKAGFLQKRGSYVEVTPRIFADYLASQVIAGRSSEIFALILGLQSHSITRLFQRMHSVENEDIEKVWDKLLGDDGLFDTLDKIIELGDLLRLIAARKPERVAAKLRKFMSSVTPVDLKKIDGDRRRDLIWSIDQLLFHEESAEMALELLKSLALAETELSISNNATGVFCECFVFWHPQFPLVLHKRLTILRELVNPAFGEDSVRLALQAINTALSQSGISFRPSTSSSPLSSRPQITNQEMWDYNEGLIDLLISISESGRPNIASEASSLLPMALRRHSDQKRLTELVKRAQKVMILWQNRKIDINVSEFAVSLNSLKEGLEPILLFPELGMERQKFETALKDTITLLEIIENGDFYQRIHRWVGGWSHSSNKIQLEDGTILYGDENEIRNLALEVIKKPELLGDDILIWLGTDKAKQGYTFLFWLGKLDTENVFLSKIESQVKNKSESSILDYFFRGFVKRSKDEAETYLEKSEQETKFYPLFYLNATHAIGGNRKGVKRIIRLINDGSLDPVIVERTLMTGGWSSTLEPMDFLDLLKSIGGNELQNANSVLDFFNMWLFQKKPVVADLVEYIWICLESCPKVNMNEAYHLDTIVTSLTPSNEDRAFALFERLLTQPYENHSWDPLDHFEGKGFFESLKRIDSNRVWSIVLGTLLNNKYRYDIEHSISSAINLPSDGLSLLEFAKASKEKALLVIDLINASQLGFWEFAESIIKLYAEDQDIENALFDSVDPFKSGGFSGPYSFHLENRRAEAEKRISKSAGNYKNWLIKVENKYKDLVPKALVDEIDEDINGFRRFHQDEFGELKAWAVSSLVKAKEYELLKKVITIDQLSKLMQSLSLSKEQQDELFLNLQ